MKSLRKKLDPKFNRNRRGVITIVWTFKENVLNKDTEKGIRIKIYRKKTHGTTKNKTL
jgi:hypothetical protein